MTHVAHLGSRSSHPHSKNAVSIDRMHKIAKFVHAHKVIIVARTSNDVCYVASRNRLNGHKAILFTSSHPQVFGAPRRRQKVLAFFCKIVILVCAHKLVIAARSSNDGCYVASRNRLNCSKAILFMSDHLQEVATSLGSHFYHIWPLFRRENGLREASRTLVGNNSWTIWRWGYSTCSWRQHNTHHLML